MATKLAVLMMEPPPARRSAGMPYLQPRKTPLTLICEGEIPHLFGGRDGVVIVGMGDAGVVEQDGQFAVGLFGFASPCASQSAALETSALHGDERRRNLDGGDDVAHSGL
jgi:hypothetical protein